MSDLLLNLGKNPVARRVIRNLKLPVPLPQELPRTRDAWEAEPLSGMQIAFASLKGGKPSETLRRSLTAAGATLRANGASHATEGAAFAALVCDATGITQIGELEGLYSFYKERVAALRPGGRVLVIGSAAKDGMTPEAAATSESLLGFVKSLGKELGRRGSTAQLVTLPGNGGDEQLVDEPLRFLLSARSAFISGQALDLTNLASTPRKIPHAKPLAGKVALVTGAGRGIGAQIAWSLAREGARVIGIDRPGEAKALAQLMQEIGGAEWVQDLLAAGAVEKLTERIKTELGAIDVLVNNAGITRDKTLGRMSREHWLQVLTLNMQVPIALTEAVAGSELMNNGGRVLFLSSIGGLAGNAGQTNYAAAKAGLVGFAKAYAGKVAARGITVNAVAPGFIETEMTRAMPVALRELGRRFNALNQAGKPEDVAELCTFLASPGAYGLTGAVVRICGLNFLGA